MLPKPTKETAKFTMCKSAKDADKTVDRIIARIQMMTLRDAARMLRKRKMIEASDLLNCVADELYTTAIAPKTTPDLLAKRGIEKQSKARHSLAGPSGAKRSKAKDTITKRSGEK